MCFAQLWHQRRFFLTFELGNPNVAHFCPHFSHMHFEGGILDPGLRDPQIHAIVNYRAQPAASAHTVPGCGRQPSYSLKGELRVLAE